MSRTILISLGLLLSPSALACESTGSGNWANASTWTACPTPSGIPETGSDVTIGAGHSVFLDTSATLGVVTVGAQAVLTLQGDLTFDATSIHATEATLVSSGVNTITTVGDADFGALGGLPELTIVAGGTSRFSGPATALSLDVQATQIVFDVDPSFISVDAIDSIVLRSPTVLAQDTSLDALNVTLSAVDGPSRLDIEVGSAFGQTTLQDRIGATTRLSSLEIRNGTIVLDMPSQGTANPSMRVTNDVRFEAPVTLARNASIVSQSQFFQSTLDGAFGLISVTTGPLELQGAVGGTTPLTALQINTVGTTFIRGGLVHADLLFNIHNQIVLDSPGGYTILRGGPMNLGIDASRAIRSSPTRAEDLVIEASSLTLRSQLGTASDPLRYVEIDAPARLEGTGATCEDWLVFQQGVTVASNPLLRATDVAFDGGPASVVSDGPTTLGVSTLDPGAEIVVGTFGTGFALNDADLAAISPQLHELQVGDPGHTGLLRGETAVIEADTHLVSATVQLDDLSTTGRLTVSGGTVAGTLAGGGEVVFESVVTPDGAFQVVGPTTLVGGLDWVDGSTLVVTDAPTLGGPLLASFPFADSGTSYLLVDNLSGQPSLGQFDGLPEGAVVSSGSDAAISYAGGDGNDVSLVTLACTDTDGDGVCDTVDPCPADFPDDPDGDGICTSNDLCFGDNATGDSDGDGVCDGSAFGLSASPAIPGQVMTFSVSHAPPGDRVLFLVSPQLSGTTACHPTLVDGMGSPLCTLLDRPVVLGSAVADALGAAEVSVRVPPSLQPGLIFFAQALHHDGTTGEMSEELTIDVL